MDEAESCKAPNVKGRGRGRGGGGNRGRINERVKCRRDCVGDVQAQRAVEGFMERVDHPAWADSHNQECSRTELSDLETVYYNDAV